MMEMRVTQRLRGSLGEQVLMAGTPGVLGSSGLAHLRTHFLVSLPIL